MFRDMFSQKYDYFALEKLGKKVFLHDQCCILKSTILWRFETVKVRPPLARLNIKKKVQNPAMRTPSRLSQDSAAFWSAGISGRWSWLCFPASNSSASSSAPWQLLDSHLGGRVASVGAESECKSRKSLAAAEALSLTGLTSASRAAASSARTRPHSVSISLMLALSCWEKKQSFCVNSRLIWTWVNK